MTETLTRPPPEAVWAPPAAPPVDPRRWAALAVIAMAELMVILDATIVNIALPAAQQELGISDPERQWVVTAYTATFGGLLLWGGRVADRWGRRRTFVVGMLGFAVASALGGSASTGYALFAARAMQGFFGALLAPAAVALIAATFSDARERAKAFAVIGGIEAGGGAIGMLLGGLLTQYESWRWCLYVNVPVAVVTCLVALPLVRESRAPAGVRNDVPGALLCTASLGMLIYGLTRAGERGWGSAAAVVPLWLAFGLFVAFVVVQRRTADPLVPPRLVLQRNRAVVLLSAMLVFGGFMGASLFLSYHLQVLLGFSALRTGLASLPIAVSVLVGAATVSRAVGLGRVKRAMVTGCLTAAAGLWWLAQLDLDSGYLTHILPTQVLIGFGLGLFIAPMTNLTLADVPPWDLGVAGGLLNATVQVGASLGIAVLGAVYSAAVAGSVSTGPTGGDAPLADRLSSLVDGYARGFGWAAGMLAVSGLLLAVFLQVRRPAAHRYSGRAARRGYRGRHDEANRVFMRCQV